MRRSPSSSIGAPPNDARAQRWFYWHLAVRGARGYLSKNFRKPASLVCRRWRRVALRLVTRLRLYLHCGAPLAQRLFAKTPRLTGIALASSNEDGPTKQGRDSAYRYEVAQ